MIGLLTGVLTLPAAPDGEWFLVVALLLPAVVKVVAHSEGSRPRAMYTRSDRLTIAAVGISFLSGGGSELVDSIELRVLVAGFAGVVTLALYFVIPAKAAKLQTNAASDQRLAWLAKRAGWLFRPSDVLAVAALWLSIILVIPAFAASWGVPTVLGGDYSGITTLVVIVVVVSWLERKTPFEPPDATSLEGADG